MRRLRPLPPAQTKCLGFRYIWGKFPIEIVLPGNGFQTAGFQEIWVKRDRVMIKKLLFAVALLSLALASGCAKGGNGAGNGIKIVINDNSVAAAGLGLTIQFTATVTGTSNPNVAWTLNGSS